MPTAIAKPPPRRQATRVQKTEWGTPDELTFVRGLGSVAHRPVANGKQRPLAAPMVLLRRYLAAMPLRQRWGSIDAIKVRAEVERLLQGANR